MAAAAANQLSAVNNANSAAGPRPAATASNASNNNKPQLTGRYNG